MKPLNSTLQKSEPLSDDTEQRKCKSSGGKTKEEGFAKQSKRSKALLQANRGSRFRVVQFISIAF